MQTTDIRKKVPVNLLLFNKLNLPNNLKLICYYLFLLLLPFMLAQVLAVQFENLYRYLLSAITLIAMMSLFLQFPLAGRLKKVALFANIDWSISKHKKIGKYIALFFFMHPLLVSLPKLFISLDTFQESIITMIQSNNLLTGVLAWLGMAIWVLMSIYKDNLSIRYETWRLLHLIGFIIIITLATFHITAIGSHGQFEPLFNIVWWFLYSFSISLVIYNYWLKPKQLSKTPFSISEIKKVSDCDWRLSITTINNKKFNYVAGQFVWINTSGCAHNLEQHPFSIADCNDNKSELTFIIRELGDYTRAIGELNIDQTVFVDGPYGSLGLNQSNTAEGITLIAGGAGIAPMLSLLRTLAKNDDQRKIRLIYANKTPGRMVCIQELMLVQTQMKNFKFLLLCEQQTQQTKQLYPFIEQGLISKRHISETIDLGKQKQWSIYLCGPEGMMKSCCANLHSLGVIKNNIHFEQLSF